METKTPAYSLKAAVVLKKKIELRFPEVVSETRPGKKWDTKYTEEINLSPLSDHLWALGLCI